MRLFSTLSKLILALIATIAPCWACIIVYQAVQVGPDFRVIVLDRGHPVNGLPVEIRDESNGHPTVVDTDSHGVALFRHVPPGTYHVSADHDAGIPDGAELAVKADGPANVTVHLKWPSIAPISVRSLQGTLSGPDYNPGVSQPVLSLDLLGGASGRLLKTVPTTSKGEFRFEGIASGLYFIGPKLSGEPVMGLIAVMVDPAATTDRLDIDLGRTSCGLWYADRNQCPQTTLTIGRLSGRVVDSSGAPIPGAGIFLVDHDQTLVERLQSDSTGQFGSARPLSGTYDLLVSAPGFRPFHGTAHAELAPDSAPYPSPIVQLGMGGSCSAVAPR